MEQSHTIRQRCVGSKHAIRQAIFIVCRTNCDPRREVAERGKIIVNQGAAADRNAGAVFLSADFLSVFGDGAVFCFTTLVDLLKRRDITDAQERMFLKIGEGFAGGPFPVSRGSDRVLAQQRFVCAVGKQ